MVCGMAECGFKSITRQEPRLIEAAQSQRQPLKNQKAAAQMTAVTNIALSGVGYFVYQRLYRHSDILAGLDWRRRIKRPEHN